MHQIERVLEISERLAKAWNELKEVMGEGSPTITPPHEPKQHVVSHNIMQTGSLSDSLSAMALIHEIKTLFRDNPHKVYKSRNLYAMWNVPSHKIYRALVCLEQKRVLFRLNRTTWSLRPKGTKSTKKKTKIKTKAKDIDDSSGARDKIIDLLKEGPKTLDYIRKHGAGNYYTVRELLEKLANNDEVKKVSVVTKTVAGHPFVSRRYALPGYIEASA